MIVVDHKQIINQESITEVRALIINSLIVILMDAWKVSSQNSFQETRYIECSLVQVDLDMFQGFSVLSEGGKSFSLRSFYT